ncbi:hypothetical protein [Botrimarina mediterranea]|uniref:hypothetical protein n=1 Tax=Botrimarina mediterranea TaxID=2528022 RepID=UPI00118812DE|nr:hypothetical protein K2D_34760 [Planctomycetes bacterium K2D]
MEPWASHLLTFLGGAAIGATGTYFADRFTDQRRDQEDRRNRKRAFDKVAALMPELLREMKQDITAPDAGTVREFFVVPTAGAVINSTHPRFRYHESEHSDLRGKAELLESNGFLIDVTSTNLPRYRMTEEFVDLLTSHKL